MSTVTEETTTVVETVVVEEPEAEAPKMRHIINPPANLHIFRSWMSSQDIVDIARVRELEVVALCGYRWVPRHNPANLPTCDDCVRIAGEILSEGS